MTPALPHSPAPAPVATCSHLLRHSDSAPPVLPVHPPQLALHSPFYDSRRGGGRRGSGTRFTAASSRRGEGGAPWRPACGCAAQPRPLPEGPRLSPPPRRPLAAGVRLCGSASAAARRDSALSASPPAALGKPRPPLPVGQVSLYSCFQIKLIWIDGHFLLVQELFGHHHGVCSRDLAISPQKDRVPSICGSLHSFSR